MAINHIKKNQIQTVELASKGSEWMVDKGVSVIPPQGHGILIAGDEISLDVDGKIEADMVSSNAIEAAGKAVRIAIGEHGRLSGSHAIHATGDQTAVTNLGKITTGAIDHIAVYLEGNGSKLANDGSIEGFDGTAVGIKSGKLVNDGAGEISGTIGVSFFGAADSVVVNRGQITATFEAVAFGEGDDRFVNRGTIEGGVNLGGGSDHIDLRKGDMFGNVIGGVGNDVFFIDNSLTEVREGAGEGYDLIWATASYVLDDAYMEFEFLGAKGSRNISLTGNSADNIIAGNRGRNALSGQAGADTFYSGAGADDLMGGANSDSFVFRKGDGHDTIGDFAFAGAEQDVIDLHFLNAFKDFADVLAVATDTADGVVLKLGKGDSLTLTGVTVNDLEMQHFDLA